MANLILDVTVKSAKQAEEEVKAIGKAGDKVQKVFDKIATSSGFTKLLKNAKLAQKVFTETNKEARDLSEKLKDVGGSSFIQAARNARKLLDIEEDINAEITKQARLQRKLGDSSGGNDQTRALTRQLNILRRQTKEIDKHARSERALELLRQRAHSRELKRIAKEKLERRQAMNARRQFLSNIAQSAGVGAVAGGVAGITFAAVEGLTRAVTGLARAWAGLGKTAAKSFFDINTEMEQMKILLGTAAGSTAGGEALFSDVLSFSERAPFSIQSLTDSFVKLKTAGLDPLNDGTLQTLADSVAAFGGNSEQLRLVTIAIQQMVGKGVVSMEELRRQFGEQVPTAMRAMAEGLGMSILDMFDLIGKGGLEAGRGIEAMLRVLDEWHGGAAEKRMNSMKGALIKVNNAWTKLMLDLGKSEGAFGGLKDVVFSAAAALDKFRTSPATKKYIDDLAKSMKSIFDEVKNNPEIITDFLSGMTNSFKAAVTWSGKLLKSITDIIQETKKFKGLNILNDIGQIPGKIASYMLRSAGNSILEMLGIDPVVANAQIKEFFLNNFIYGREAAQAEMARASAEMVNNSRFTPDYSNWEATQDDVEALENAISRLTPISQQFVVAFKKGLGDISAQLEVANKDVISASEKLLEFRELMKTKVSGYKSEEDALFATNMSFDESLAKVAQLEAEAAGIADGANDGWKKQVELLEAARKILLGLKADAEAVSKAQVDGAKKAYEAYYKASRGGKAAGSVSELKELRNEYIRLAKLQKEGKADAREENKIKAEQKSLLEANRQKLEAVYNAQKGHLEEAEAEALTRVHALELTEKAVNKYGDEAVATSERIQVKLQEEIELYYEIMRAAQAARSVQVSSPASGATYNPTSYPGKYAGGPVESNQPYIVGERGPELFVPQNNGKIIPNNQLSGGQSTEINLSFNGNKVGPMFSTKQVAREVLREFEIMQGALS